jgi:hypothetical protein
MFRTQDWSMSWGLLFQSTLLQQGNYLHFDNTDKVISYYVVTFISEKSKPEDGDRSYPINFMC